jgi:hypothetical protein
VVLGPAGGTSSAHGTHMFKARAGHHLAPAALSPARDVFEELGPGFTLLAFDVEDQTIRSFEQAAATLAVPLKVIRDSYRDARQAYESRLILVRPDQYVAWTGDSGPDDPRPLMSKVTGRA